MRRVDDRFKLRAYSWSQGLEWATGVKTFTRDDTVHTVKACCNIYEVEPPTIVTRSRGKISEYAHRANEIRIVSHHENPFLVTHEAAHCISIKKLGLFAHNKRWLGIWQWLLTYFDFIESPMLRATMEAYKLPWCPLSPKQLEE